MPATESAPVLHESPPSGDAPHNVRVFERTPTGKLRELKKLRTRTRSESLANVTARHYSKQGYVTTVAPAVHRRKEADESAKENPTPDPSGAYAAHQRRMRTYVHWASKGEREYVPNSAIPGGDGKWTFWTRPVGGGRSREERVTHAEIMRAPHENPAAAEKGTVDKIVDDIKQAVGGKKKETDAERRERMAKRQTRLRSDFDTVCLPTIKVERSAHYNECLERARALGKINTPAKVYELIGPTLEKEDQEVLLVVPLDVHYKLRGGVVEVHRGSRSRVEVSTADILRAALVAGASHYILAHCHPSGSARASRADKALTKSVERATKSIDVVFLDHVVVGRGEYYSIREGRLYKARKRKD
jgi:RadC-like JAB domain